MLTKIVGLRGVGKWGSGEDYITIYVVYFSPNTI
jgi:hypothetical protein